jgi:putative nucleotidyltransferase with HDIG domain
MGRSNIAATILAAGWSSRMGRFKPLLPIGDVPILERAIGLFNSVGVEEVVVVTGRRREDLTPLIDQYRAREANNKEFHLGMYSSVKTGVAALNDRVEAFFMLPVDIPLVRPATLRLLLRKFRSGRHSIIYPTIRGRRGHPPLIGVCHVERILAHPGTGGLKAVLKQHDNEACEVATPDEYVLFDIDTPEDYQEILRRFRRYDMPTTTELGTLVRNTFRLSGNLLRHSREVAQVALLLAEALNGCGRELDLDLIVAGGFLHDISKGEPDHALSGADILTQMGFNPVAKVIAAHTDHIVQPNTALTEAEVVYFADKLVLGDQLVSIEERFKEAYQRCRTSPEGLRALQSRYENALSTQRRIEGALGRSLESVLREAHLKNENDRISSVLALTR